MFSKILLGVFVSGCLAFPLEDKKTDFNADLLPINPDVIKEPKPADKIIPITDPKEIEKIKREIPAPTEKPTQLRQDFFPVDVNVPTYPLQQQQSPVSSSLKTKRNIQEEHKEPSHEAEAHETHKETSLKDQPTAVPSTLPLLHPVQRTETKEDVKRDIPVPLEPKHKHEHHETAEESEHVHHHEHNEDEEKQQQQQQHTSTSTSDEQHVLRTKPIPVAELFGRKHE